jgi:hypothetical protein
MSQGFLDHADQRLLSFFLQATALVYFKRYHLVVGVWASDPLRVLLTCIYLAAKVCISYFPSMFALKSVRWFVGLHLCVFVRHCAWAAPGSQGAHVCTILALFVGACMCIPVTACLGVAQLKLDLHAPVSPGARCARHAPNYTICLVISLVRSNLAGAWQPRCVYVTA